MFTFLDKEYQMFPYRIDLYQRFIPKRRLLETWTGRITLINTLVFIFMSIESSSIFLPDVETLYRYGVKDDAALIAGEWWRLITPMFVHIGIIHFALNSLALIVVGLHVEYILKARLFILFYLVAGIGATIASCITNLGLSAGASGAIFGLLGIGWVYERKLNKTILYKKEEYDLAKIPPLSPYRNIIIINVVLGFFLSFGSIRVDQAAHLGGLFMGIALGWISYFIISHPFREKKNRLIPVLIALPLAFFIFSGGVAATSKDFVEMKIDLLLDVAEAQQNEEARYTAKVSVLNEALRIFPERKDFQKDFGWSLLFLGDFERGFQALDDVENFDREEVNAKIDQLSQMGKRYAALQTKRYFEDRGLLDAPQGG